MAGGIGGGMGEGPLRPVPPPDKGEIAGTAPGAEKGPNLAQKAAAKGKGAVAKVFGRGNRQPDNPATADVNERVEGDLGAIKDLPPEDVGGASLSEGAQVWQGSRPGIVRNSEASLRAREQGGQLTAEQAARLQSTGWSRIPDNQRSIEDQARFASEHAAEEAAVSGSHEPPPLPLKLSSDLAEAERQFPADITVNPVTGGISGKLAGEPEYKTIFEPGAFTPPVGAESVPPAPEPAVEQSVSAPEPAAAGGAPPIEPPVTEPPAPPAPEPQPGPGTDGAPATAPLESTTTAPPGVTETPPPPAPEPPVAEPTFSRRRQDEFPRAAATPGRRLKREASLRTEDLERAGPVLPPIPPEEPPAPPTGEPLPSDDGRGRENGGQTDREAYRSRIRQGKRPGESERREAPGVRRAGRAETSATAGEVNDTDTPIVTPAELEFYNSALKTVSEGGRMSPREANKFAELSRTLATGVRSGSNRPETAGNEQLQYDIGFSRNESFIEKKLDQIGNMSAGAMQREHNRVARAIAGRTRTLNNPYKNETDYAVAERDSEALDEIKKDLETTMANKNVPIQSEEGVAGGGPTAANERLIEEARTTSLKRAEEASEVMKMKHDKEGLGLKEFQLTTQIDALKKQLIGLDKNSAVYRAFTGDIAHMESLVNKIKELRPRAAEKTKAKKAKNEKKTAKDEAKKLEGEEEDSWLADPNIKSGDIQARMDTLMTRDANGVIDDGRIFNLDTEIANLKGKVDAGKATKGERRDYMRKRNERVEEQRRLTKLNSAFKEVQTREKSKNAAEKGMTRDSIKQFTDEELQKMSTEEIAKYLRTLGRVFPLTAIVNGTETPLKAGDEVFKLQLGILKSKLLTGVDISAKDMAQFVEAAGDLIILKGRKAIDMKELQLINSKYPEIREALADKLQQSEAAKQMREKFPSKWEKMTKYAKGKPGWLMLLIFLIAGGALGAVKLGSGAVGGSGHQV